jgi:MscS family membrane protein
VLRHRLDPAVLHAPSGLKWPICLTVMAITWSVLTPYFGIPRELIVITSGISALVLSVGVVWAGWQIIDLVGNAIARRGAAPQAPLDEIVSHLLIGLVRVALVIAALVYVADALSIPYSGLVAGLGISGLAVAFASKETLSNVFGAGILVIDRPFRRGDLITAGDTRGTVEHVGIRSTRIRTSEDSVLIVPNGKLADATINNMGTRRHRLAQASLTLPFTVLPERVTEFIEKLRATLAASPHVVDDRTQLGVSSLSSSGTQVDLTCYLDVASSEEERAVKQALMLDIFRLGDQMGIPPLGSEPKPVVDAQPEPIAAK